MRISRKFNQRFNHCRSPLVFGGRGKLISSILLFSFISTQAVPSYALKPQETQESAGLEELTAAIKRFASPPVLQPPAGGMESHVPDLVEVVRMAERQIFGYKRGNTPYGIDIRSIVQPQVLEILKHPDWVLFPENEESDKVTDTVRPIQTFLIRGPLRTDGNWDWDLHLHFAIRKSGEAGHQEPVSQWLNGALFRVVLSEDGRKIERLENPRVEPIVLIEVQENNPYVALGVMDEEKDVPPLLEDEAIEQVLAKALARAKQSESDIVAAIQRNKPWFVLTQSVNHSSPSTWLLRQIRMLRKKPTRKVIEISIPTYLPVFPYDAYRRLDRSPSVEDQTGLSDLLSALTPLPEEPSIIPLAAGMEQVRKAFVEAVEVYAQAVTGFAWGESRVRIVESRANPEGARYDRTQSKQVPNTKEILEEAKRNLSEAEDALREAALAMPSYEGALAQLSQISLRKLVITLPEGFTTEEVRERIVNLIKAASAVPSLETDLGRPITTLPGFRSFPVVHSSSGESFLSNAKYAITQTDSSRTRFGIIDIFRTRPSRFFISSESSVKYLGFHRDKFGHLAGATEDGHLYLWNLALEERESPRILAGDGAREEASNYFGPMDLEDWSPAAELEEGSLQLLSILDAWAAAEINRYGLGITDLYSGPKVDIKILEVGYEWPPFHKHREEEWYYIMGGEAIVRIDGVYGKIGRGGLVVVRADRPHAIRSANKSRPVRFLRIDGTPYKREDFPKVGFQEPKKIGKLLGDLSVHNLKKTRPGLLLPGGQLAVRLHKVAPGTRKRLRSSDLSRERFLFRVQGHRLFIWDGEEEHSLTGHAASLSPGFSLEIFNGGSSEAALLEISAAGMEEGLITEWELAGEAGTLPVRLYQTPVDIGQAQAEQVMALWTRAVEENRPFVIGLATGSTPQPLLTALADRLNGMVNDQERALYLNRLYIVTMDDIATEEGNNIEPDHESSAYRFYQEKFFDLVQGFDFDGAWTDGHLFVPTVIDGTDTVELDIIRPVLQLGGVQWQLMATDPNEGHVGEVWAGELFGTPHPRFYDLSELWLQHNQWARGYKRITLTLDDFLALAAENVVVSSAIFGSEKQPMFNRFAQTVRYDPNLPISFLRLPEWDEKNAQIEVLADVEVVGEQHQQGEPLHVGNFVVNPMRQLPGFHIIRRVEDPGMPRERFKLQRLDVSGSVPATPFLMLRSHLDSDTRVVHTAAGMEATPSVPSKPRLVRSFEEPKKGTFSILNVVFSPDGKSFASRNRDGKIRIRSVDPSDEPMRILEIGDRGLTSTLAFSRDGKKIAVSVGGKVLFWDVKTGKAQGELIAFPSNPASQVRGIAFSPDPDGSRLLATADSEGMYAPIWDLDSRRIVNFPSDALDRSQDFGDGTFDHTGTWSVVFSPDGKMLATGNDDGKIRLWNSSSGQMEYAPLEAGPGRILEVAFSPNGKYLASRSHLDVVHRWDTSGWERVTEPRGARSKLKYFASFAFSPDSTTLVLGGKNDGKVHTVNLTTGQYRGAFSAHDVQVNNVAFSLDEKILLTRSDRHIKLWDLSAAGLPADDLRAGMESIEKLAKVLLSRDTAWKATGRKNARNELMEQFRPTTVDAERRAIFIAIVGELSLFRQDPEEEAPFSHLARHSMLSDFSQWLTMNTKVPPFLKKVLGGLVEQDLPEATRIRETLVWVKEVFSSSKPGRFASLLEVLEGLIEVVPAPPESAWEETDVQKVIDLATQSLRRGRNVEVSAPARNLTFSPTSWDESELIRAIEATFSLSSGRREKVDVLELIHVLSITSAAGMEQENLSFIPEIREKYGNNPYAVSVWISEDSVAVGLVNAAGEVELGSAPERLNWRNLPAVRAALGNPAENQVDEAITRLIASDNRGDAAGQITNLVSEQAVDQIVQLIEATGLRHEDFRYVLVNVAGPVDSDTGLVGTLFAVPHLPGMENYPLTREIRQRVQERLSDVDVVVGVMNDADADLYGETSSIGTAYGAEDVMVFHLGNKGVNAAAMKDGRLDRFGGAIYESGHTTVVKAGVGREPQFINRGEILQGMRPELAHDEVELEGLISVQGINQQLPERWHDWDALAQAASQENLDTREKEQARRAIEAIGETVGRGIAAILAPAINGESKFLPTDIILTDQVGERFALNVFSPSGKDLFLEHVQEGFYVQATRDADVDHAIAGRLRDVIRRTGLGYHRGFAAAGPQLDALLQMEVSQDDIRGKYEKRSVAGAIALGGSNMRGGMTDVNMLVETRHALAEVNWGQMVRVRQVLGIDTSDAREVEKAIEALSKKITEGVVASVEKGGQIADLIMAEIIHHAVEVIRNSGLPYEQFKAFLVSIPGPVSQDRRRAGVPFPLPNVPGMDNYPVAAKLEQGIEEALGVQLKVVLYNDADVGRIAEGREGGTVPGSKAFISYILGTGDNGTAEKTVDGVRVQFDGQGTFKENGHSIVEKVPPASDAATDSGEGIHFEFLGFELVGKRPGQVAGTELVAGQREFEEIVGGRVLRRRFMDAGFADGEAVAEAALNNAAGTPLGGTARRVIQTVGTIVGRGFAALQAPYILDDRPEFHFIADDFVMVSSVSERFAKGVDQDADGTDLFIRTVRDAAKAELIALGVGEKIAHKVTWGDERGKIYGRGIVRSDMDWRREIAAAAILLEEAAGMEGVGPLLNRPGQPHDARRSSQIVQAFDDPLSAKRDTRPAPRALAGLESVTDLADLEVGPLTFKPDLGSIIDAGRKIRIPLQVLKMLGGEGLQLSLSEETKLQLQVVDSNPTLIDLSDGFSFALSENEWRVLQSPEEGPLRLALLWERGNGTLIAHAIEEFGIPELSRIVSLAKQIRVTDAAAEMERKLKHVLILGGTDKSIASVRAAIGGNASRPGIQVTVFEMPGNLTDVINLLDSDAANEPPDGIIVIGMDLAEDNQTMVALTAMDSIPLRFLSASEIGNADAIEALLVQLGEQRAGLEGDFEVTRSPVTGHTSTTEAPVSLAAGLEQVAPVEAVSAEQVPSLLRNALGRAFTPSTKQLWQVHIFDPVNADLGRLVAELVTEPVVIIARDEEHAERIRQSGFIKGEWDDRLIVNLEEYGNDIERARVAAASRFAPMFDPQYYRAGDREKLLLWVVGIMERYDIPDSALSRRQAERLLRALAVLRAA